MQKDTASVGEILKQRGWNTLWSGACYVGWSGGMEGPSYQIITSTTQNETGKNHNVPDWQSSRRGPSTSGPTTWYEALVPVLRYGPLSSYMLTLLFLSVSTRASRPSTDSSAATPARCVGIMKSDRSAETAY